MGGDNPIQFVFFYYWNVTPVMLSLYQKEFLLGQIHFNHVETKMDALEINAIV